MTTRGADPFSRNTQPTRAILFDFTTANYLHTGKMRMSSEHILLTILVSAVVTVIILMLTKR
jgi:hypothetical protein